MNVLKRILKTKDKPIFTFIIISYALLSILPVLILGGVSYITLKSNVESKTINANIERISQIKSSIDFLFNNIEEKSLTLLMDNMFLDIKNIGWENIKDSNNIIKIREVQDKLHNYDLSNELIESVYFYNADKDILLTGTESMKLEGFFDKQWYGENMNFCANKYWIGLRRIGCRWWSYEQTNPLYTVSFISTFFTYQFSFRGALVTNIKLNELQKAISKILGNVEGKLYIVSDTGQVISGTDDAIAGELLFEDITRSMDEKQSGYVVCKNDNDTFIYYYAKSKNGWIYLLKNPSNNLLNISSNIGLVILVMLVLLSFSSIILSAYMSRKLYNPIDKLIYAVKDIGRNKLNNRLNEFEIIKHSIESMFSERKDMICFIDSNISSIKGNIFRSLICGEFHDKDELIKKMNYMGIAIKNKYFCAVIVKIRKNSDILNEKENLVLQQKLLPNFFEAVSDDEVKCLGAFERYNNVVLIFNFNERENIKRYLEYFTKSIKKTMYLDVSNIAGGICNDIFDLGNSYMQAYQILNFRMLTEQDFVVFYDETNLADTSPPKYQFDVEEETVNWLKTGNIEKAMDSFRRFLKYISQKTENNKVYIENYCIQFISFIIRCMELHGSYYSDIFKNEVYRDFLKTNFCLDNIEVWFSNFLNELMIDAVFKEKEKYDKYEQSIKNYIHYNYYKDISLEMVADDMGISYSYMRKIFTKIFGCGFAYYINSIRIDKAKKIMEETQKSISEIMNEIGYNNVQTFYTNFKRLTGFTPGEYNSNFGFNGDSTSLNPQE